MVYPTTDIISLKHKLYQRYKDFKRFENIDEERQEELRNDISYLTENNEKLDLYIRMLELLVNDYRRQYTYDEKIFCLIEACDPNLDFLRMYNRFQNPKKGQIEYEQYLNEARKITGFSDDYVRKYENAYLRNIVFKKAEQESIKTLSRTRKR